MRKIAVSLSKGGVGKTTTAVNVSFALARKGAKVLLVDTDTQGQAAKALGVRPEAGLADLVTGNTQADKAIIDARPGLWLLAGGKNLAGIKRLIDRQDIAGEKLLAETLAPLDDQYDYVILDTGPGWDALTVNVLFYAEELLVPVSVEALAVHGLGEFIKSLVAVQKYHSLILRYIVPTFYDRRVSKSSEILEQLQEHFQEKLCSPIRYNVRLSEAPGYGQTIFEYAPSSPGAEDYQKLTERIMSNGRA